MMRSSLPSLEMVEALRAVTEHGTEDADEQAATSQEGGKVFVDNLLPATGASEG
ncbi:hypothetical protein SAMN05519103_01809 [Rhizobiales bacterium GAS113]|nr:hypothetical protein SAMN05519103_01809 [Rhizobiales bacterium GAS113]